MISKALIKSFWLMAVTCLLQHVHAQKLIVNNATGFDIAKCNILVDADEEALIQKAATLFQNDVAMVTGKKLSIINEINSSKPLVIIGTIGSSKFIKQLIKAGKINASSLESKWEGYSLQTISAPFKGVPYAIVISGNDRRGAAFGLFEMSGQMGVSPWYWWADVPVQKRTAIWIDSKQVIKDAPKVKYRGIFINDEAPALSNWSREKFGGFNRKFYEKVFELMLRLKSNYIWPAMWGSAFYDDDSLNIKMADDYGIVIGTSHHEPLMRAHDEWRRYGQGGEWNYEKNKAALQNFWRHGMKRATNEKIVSVGMRGDGDEPMTRETATALLETIVKDQREIIEEVNGRPASETPQLWALYKEVQDYYDKGMRVPDDVTLLLCDDNWGNIRRLPKPDEKQRRGGYGIYYHFDYVGGPRNYKWINTNPIPRVWEQMNLAWQHNVRQIWIVNVGDIKPMEFPISFFLDCAWNPDKTGAGDLQKYIEQWAALQFGKEHAKGIAAIISSCSKFAGRRKPELLNENTYSLLNYSEFGRVVDDYKKLLEKALSIQQQLPAVYHDAYYQLVLHPVEAMANLHQMYYYVACNQHAYQQKAPLTNHYADLVKEYYLKDSLITKKYHSINNGKWNYMMSQTHIGYTYWQQPPVNKMPEVKYLSENEITNSSVDSVEAYIPAAVPKNIKGNTFYESGGYVSIEAANYTDAVHSKSISWKVLPDHGKTGSAVTTFPVTAAQQMPGGNAPHLQYDFYTHSKGAFKIDAFFSPTLNIYNSPTGLQYAISVDDETPQIISINKDDNVNRTWEKWVSNNIIIKTSDHKILDSGRHTVKYWMVSPAVVLQKFVLDFGGVKASYLGPPQTSINKQ